MAEESLIEFPCHLPVKVMGRNTPEFLPSIVAAAASQAGPIADSEVSVRLSRDSRFASLTLTVFVESHDHLRRVYTAMHATGLVLYAL